MFEFTSRYYGIETAHHPLSDGRTIAYKRRRFLPNLENQPTLAEVTVAAGDRLDLISARILGDSEQFWHLCDVNPVLSPDELTASPGRLIRIALPQPQPTVSPQTSLPTG